MGGIKNSRINPNISRMKWVLLLVILLVILSPFVLIHCNRVSHTTCLKSGKRYGTVRGNFRDRWWNYYERGLSYAEGECFKDALEDFREAIKQRKEDQRKARTYGVEFIDYFPHREMGKIYYQMGRYDLAKKELEYSVGYCPSQKAYFYLDRVRMALITEEGKEISTPELFLNLDTNEVWTKDNQIVISGYAKDECYISGISVNGKEILHGESKKYIPFEKSLLLFEGTHIVVIEARNIFGKVTSEKVKITLDREGPLFTISNLSSDQSKVKKTVTIIGFLYDRAGISDLSIHGENIPVQQGIEIPFDHTFTIDENTTFTLVAHDLLGNKTYMDVSLGSLSSHIPIRLACTDLIVKGDLASVLQDITPPTIDLLGGLTEKDTVHWEEEIYVQAEVSDKGIITDLAVNDVPVFRKQGKIIRFGHMIKLSEGENRITIEATDKGGNKAQKVINVTRKIPRALRLEERLCLAVLPFKHMFEDDSKRRQTSHNFYRYLKNAFLKRDRFRLCDEKGQLEIKGRFLEGLDLEFSGELIDTETSEILVFVDVFHEEKSHEILKELAEGMANMFVRKYPLLTGRVLFCEKNKITTNLGWNNAKMVGGENVKIPKRLIIYRDSPRDTIVGSAQIIASMKETSLAELMDCNPGAINSNLDKVITK